MTSKKIQIQTTVGGKSKHTYIYILFTRCPSHEIIYMKMLSKVLDCLHFKINLISEEYVETFSWFFYLLNIYIVGRTILKV